MNNIRSLFRGRPIPVAAPAEKKPPLNPSPPLNPPPVQPQPLPSAAAVAPSTANTTSSSSSAAVRLAAARRTRRAKDLNTTATGNTTTGSTSEPPILSVNGPLDATSSDFAVPAKILDTDDFRGQVLATVQARHPNDSLVSTDVLKAIVQAVALDVDEVSPMVFAPLLIAVLKQVFAVKTLRDNLVARKLLTLEVVKAFVLTAYGASNIPPSLRVLCALGIDSMLPLIVKDNGSLVQTKKLRSLVKYQLDKASAPSITKSK